jgi:L-xylulokinase
MAYLLGIDNGGTMTKAAIFDERGGEIAVASVQTPLITPRDGYQERDMDALWMATAACIREAIQKAGVSPAEIAGVGCCGHGKGLYLLGKDGKPAMNAIASTDRRAAHIVEQWQRDGTADAAAKRTLQPVIASQPVALLQWLKRERPEVLENVQWIFEAKDYIRYMLTAEAYAEETDYSGTSMMNLNTRSFDREIMNLFGIGELYDCLPPLRRSYEQCGAITDEAARQTGLAAGTPVCGGMFDIDACAIAMGVTTPEKLCVITGTWSINEYISDRPVRADTTTLNSLFCMEGTYLIEESSPTSAGNLNWFLDNFMKAEREQATARGESIYDTANALVAGLSPEQSNVLFLPFLYGTNTGVRNACFVDLTNDQGAAHMLRAIYEGVVFCHYMHVENLYAFRSPPEAIQLAGGACNSPVWVQMFADVFGLPVEAVATKELGAMGAAMAAAVAAGLYRDYADAAAHMVHIHQTVRPQPRHTEIYKKKYARYKKLIALLSRLGEE